MPQQLDSMVSTFKSGNEAQHLLDRLERAEGFLWQWPCTSGLVGDGAERQLQPAGLGLAHQEFLEQSARGRRRPWRRRPCAARRVRRARSAGSSARGRRSARRARQRARTRRPDGRARPWLRRRDRLRGMCGRSTAGGCRSRASADARDSRRPRARAARRRDFRARRCD